MSVFLFSTLTPACHHTTCPKFGAFALFMWLALKAALLICSPSSIASLYLIPLMLLSVHHPSPVNDPHALAVGSLCLLEV